MRPAYCEHLAENPFTVSAASLMGRETERLQGLSQPTSLVTEDVTNLTHYCHRERD